MPYRLFLVVLAVPAAWAASGCTRLDAGQSLSAVLTRADPPCYLITVKPDAPIELVAAQPVDLEFLVTAAGPSDIIDAFELGPETVTIATPGEYRVTVRPVAQTQTGPVTVAMSSRVALLPGSEIRAAAEVVGTRAKRSGKSEDQAAALELWTKTDDASAIGRTYLQTGFAAYNASDLPAARDAFGQSLASCRRAPELHCVAAAANNGGFVAQQLGDFEAALALLTEAATTFNALGDHIPEGQALSNLGFLFRLTGDYQAAIDYYDRAQIILKDRDLTANARVLNNLGVCYQSLAEYQQARNYFGRALADFKAHSDPKDAVRARLNLGRNWLLEGHPAEARKILTQALDEAAALNDRAARADSLDNLGRSWLADGAGTEAEGALRQALELHRGIGDKNGEAMDLHYLGETAGARGESSQAHDYFTAALDIRIAYGRRDLAADSIFALAGLEASAGHAGAARDLAGRGLILMESVRSQVPGAALRASYYARERKFLDLLVDLAADPANPHAAEDGLLAAEQSRGRALTDLLAEGRLLQQIPNAVQLRRRDVQHRIDLLANRLLTAPPERNSEIRRLVEGLTAEDEQIEARIRMSLSADKLDSPLPSVATLQADGLPAGSALLEYRLTDKAGYLWVVRESGVQLFRLPPRQAVESECEAVLRWFPAVLERKRSPEKQRRFEQALARLSRTLLGPLANLTLPPRLAIVPDGVLSRIPFAALQHAGQPLGLNYDLVQAPSAAYLTAGRTPRSATDFPKTFLAFADPVYSSADPRVPQASRGPGSESDLARLPFHAELQTAASLVPTSRRRILAGFDAAAGTVKLANVGDYAMVEFSAHTLIDDRVPELSRVALSMVGTDGRAVDGYLRPYQFSQLNWNGATIVLSACQTALGKEVPGEGLEGFSTSLFAAGAGRLVLSLAPIDAEGSAEFLSETYRNYFGARSTSLEHAATLARRALARSNRWSDPFYWASFAIYGRLSR